MLEYIKNPGKLSCLDEFKKHKYSTVKIQCIGPAILFLNGYSKDEAVGRAGEHIFHIIDGLDAKEIILFLDEPSLGDVGIDYKVLWEELFEGFETFGITKGVHTCGNMQWDYLLDSSLEIISFDASQYGSILVKDPKYKNNEYRNKKRIAWGVRDKKDVLDFWEGDLITPPCGLQPKLYNVKDCEKTLEKLTNISKEVYS